ncbi:MAG: hypothetical protein AAGM84_07700 [Pseudomonadota bacterium]
MLDVIVALIALSSGPADNTAAPDVASAPAEAAPAAPALVAEPQVATGQFTTALEVRPILGATRNNWVAVREFDGQDLVYVTHLWAWRCGLARIEFSVNGAPLQDWPMPDCHLGTAMPNAVTADDGLPYQTFPLGSVGSVSVRITYDDLGVEEAQWQRAQVLMP